MADQVGVPTRARFVPGYGLLLFCFFLSGVAGLIYQSAWSQEFALVFGTSELAIATVLAAYMGGLAFGAWLAAKFALKIRHPIWGYALLELGIAISALTIPQAVEWASHFQVVFLGSDSLGSIQSSGMVLYDLAASFVILMIPTAMMGATLPLLARHVVRSDKQIGPRIGQLYTVNTIGAAVGALAAAYWFLPHWGLGITLWFAVGSNVLVFLAAAQLARRFPFSESAILEQKPAKALLGSSRILWFIALSGAVSFTLEILWTRLLAQVLGGTVYAFGIMLTTFLTGIALGSWVASRLATHPRRSLCWFGLAQAGVGIFTLAAFLVADQLPQWVASMGTGFDALLWSGSLLCSVTLLPAAICSGATFPLAVRIYARNAEDSAQASARVFAWNTLGAIFGAVLAGFWVIPRLNFNGTVSSVICLSWGLSLLSLLWFRESGHRTENLEAKRAAPYILRFAMIALCVGMVEISLNPLPQPWSLLRASALDQNPYPAKVAYFAVGRSANVMVTEHGHDWRLSTNGLPESLILAPESSVRKLSVARWLSLLPLVARPDAENLLVVGFGAGVTVQDLPPQIRKVDVVELEPEVLRANQAFRHLRGQDPLADPRVNVHFNDARSALLLTQQNYDAIISQPSHPWTSAASHLFTREFFQLVADRLGEDGVFVQWIGLQFVDEALLKILLATLQSVFPEVELYAPGQHQAVLFLASKQSLMQQDRLPETLKKARQAWAAIGVHRPEDILIARILDSVGTKQIAESSPVSTDHRNLLKIGSPKVIHNQVALPDLLALNSSRDVLGQGITDSQRLYLVRSLLAGKQVARLKRLLPQFEDPTMLEIAQSMLALHGRQPGAGIQRLLGTLGHPEGRFEAEALLLMRMKNRLVAQGTGNLPWEARLSPLGQTLVRAWRMEASQQWSGLANLDRELAPEDLSHPFARFMLHLQVKWRLKIGTQQNQEEARSLMNTLMSLQGPFVEDLLLRVQVAFASKNLAMGKAALADLAQAVQPMRANRVQKLDQILATLAKETSSLPLDCQRWAQETFPDLASEIKGVGSVENEAGHVWEE